MQKMRRLTIVSTLFLLACGPLASERSATQIAQIEQSRQWEDRSGSKKNGLRKNSQVITFDEKPCPKGRESVGLRRADFMKRPTIHGHHKS